MNRLLPCGFAMRFMRAFALIIGLLSFPLVPGSAASAANAAIWKQHTVLPGTDFATQYYVADSGQPGKRVLMIAPHSDEESAGKALEEFVKTYRPTRGVLIVCPWPIAPAKRLRARFYLEDINRQYAHTQDNHTPIDVIAHSVMSWMRMHKIDYALNMHEGYGKFRLNWNSNYGQSIFIDDPSVIPLAERVAKQVNARLARENHFLVAQVPMPTTFTWYCQTIGVPAFGIEIERGLSMERRLLYHKIVLEEFFKAVGIPLETIRR